MEGGGGVEQEGVGRQGCAGRELANNTASTPTDVHGTRSNVDNNAGMDGSYGIFYISPGVF